MTELSSFQPPNPEKQEAPPTPYEILERLKKEVPGSVLSIGKKEVIYGQEIDRRVNILAEPQVVEYLQRIPNQNVLGEKLEPKVEKVVIWWVTSPDGMAIPLHVKKLEGEGRHDQGDVGRYVEPFKRFMEEVTKGNEEAIRVLEGRGPQNYNTYSYAVPGRDSFKYLKDKETGKEYPSDRLNLPYATEQANGSLVIGVDVLPLESALLLDPKVTLVPEYAVVWREFPYVATPDGAKVADVAFPRALEAVKAAHAQQAAAQQEQVPSNS